MSRKSVFDLRGYHIGYRVRDHRFLVLLYGSSGYGILKGSRKTLDHRSEYPAECLVETPVIVYGGSDQGSASNFS